MPEDNSNNLEDNLAGKRELENGGADGDAFSNKKIKTENDGEGSGVDESNGGGSNDLGGNLGIGGGDGAPQLNWEKEMAFVPPGTVGVTAINDNDVLSGRGGGTNLHPGNRQFRDLINLYRRDYLKARKNDKPAISRSIVNAIREKNGRFLKKVEKSGLWFEIGDDAAREKTSQALRQRAPEMRKLLLDHEMEAGRSQQQQQMMMGVPPMMMNMNMNMPMMMGPNGNPMAFNPAMMGMPNAAGQMQMFNPALMGMAPMNFNGMPPYDANGNPMQQQLNQQQPQQGNNNNNNNSNMGNPMGMDQNQMNQNQMNQNQQQQPQDNNQQQQQQQQQPQQQQQQQPLSQPQQQQDQNNQQQIQQQHQQPQQQQNPQSNPPMGNPNDIMGMNQHLNPMTGMPNPMGGAENNNQALPATM